MAYISFTLLRVGSAYMFSITTSGTTEVLPNQTTLQYFTVVPEPWLFCGFTACLFLCRCFSKICRMSCRKASLCIWALYHQCSGPILLMWGRRTGTSGYHPIMYCGTLWVAFRNIWKVHCRPFHMKANWPYCQGMFNSRIPVCCFLSLLSPLFLISS